MSQRRPWKLWSMNSCCVMYGEGGLAACCENKETAAQIIREHNAYDDLVKACRAARKLLCELAGPIYHEQAMTKGWPAVNDMLRDALAIAKAEPV